MKKKVKKPVYSRDWRVNFLPLGLREIRRRSSMRKNCTHLTVIIASLALVASALFAQDTAPTPPNPVPTYQPKFPGDPARRPRPL